MKKTWLLLLVCGTAAAVLGFAIPQRTKTILLRAGGKIEVSNACSVFSPGIFDDEDRFQSTTKEIHEVQRDGPVAMYDTPIGSIWYPVSAWTLPALVEKNESDEYHFRSMVKPGDVVLDVGANVGVETRSALAAGARLVVAIEPEPLNAECLRRNLISEIREKRVIIVPRGAWDAEGLLPLYLDPANAGGASLVWRKSDRSIQVPLTTIDRLVADLKLTEVNVIKMHVEGAEKRALLGAAETIRRYHPRIAVVLEHYLDDVHTLPAVARDIWPGYHVELTRCTKTFNRIHPEVALVKP